MPSLLFHELIGYKLAQKYKKYDCDSFYLGIIVPDSVNAYGFAKKEDRWKAHFRDDDLDIWEKNILKFYFENKEKFEEAYVTGYLVHVLTDIICDRVYFERIYPDLLNKGYNYNTAFSFYTEKLKIIENSNINEYWWEYVKDKFKSAKVIEINGIYNKMIEDEVCNVLNQYKDRKYNEKDSQIENFVDIVFEELERILKCNNII